MPAIVWQVRANSSYRDLQSIASRKVSQLEGPSPAAADLSLCSAFDRISRAAMMETHTGKATSGLWLVIGCWCFRDRDWKAQSSANRLDLAQLNVISIHFFLCSLFSPASQIHSCRLLQPPFPVAHLAVDSSMCWPMHTRMYKPMPPPSPGPQVASSGCSSAPLGHISFTQKSLKFALAAGEKKALAARVRKHNHQNQTIVTIKNTLPVNKNQYYGQSVAMSYLCLKVSLHF